MFQSKTLSNFTNIMKSAGIKMYDGNMFRGLAWDQVPESDVAKVTSANMKQYINDDSWTLIWVALKLTQTKYKPPTYTRYGAQLDNSKYLTPGTRIVTRGRTFLYGSNTIQSIRPAVDSYDKPSAVGTVKALSEFIDQCAVIAIKTDSIKKYSTDQLRMNRYGVKSTTTAMLNPDKIKSDNIRRYKGIIAKNKQNRVSKPYVDEVKALTIKVNSTIEKLHSNLLGKGTRSYDQIHDFDPLSYGTKRTELVSQIVSKYNMVLYRLNRIMEVSTSTHGPASVRETQLDDKISDFRAEVNLLNDLLSKANV